MAASESLKIYGLYLDGGRYVLTCRKVGDLEYEPRKEAANGQATGHG